jgi:hypothetical protein
MTTSRCGNGRTADSSRLCLLEHIRGTKVIDRTFRSSASFGKRQEYIAIAELLRRGLDVYMTLVDDLQIDCIIRLPSKPPIYIDVQIKARSNNARYAGTFSAMEIREPRENFIFLFYSEACDTYWVMPSLDVVRFANRNKGGKNSGKFRLVFCNCNAAGKWVPRPKWREYQNAFHLIGQVKEAGKVKTKSA